MTRFVACLSAVFFSCTAFAQVPTPASAPAQPPIASTSSPDVQQFQKLEDAWADAINRRDQYSLENVLSPLFIDVSANGDITTRNQQVAFLITADDKSLHLDQKVIAVRMLGDTAVANGTYALHHKASSGQIDEKGVFTHVFERARGGWMCINSQRTSLREDSTGKKRQSNAELPFHIPLFSKGEKKEQ